MTSRSISPPKSVPPEPARKRFDTFEDKTEEALASFVSLNECLYASKRLGSAKIMNSWSVIVLKISVRG